MAFEGLRDQLKDKWADAVSAIQENPTFNSAREQFESQPRTTQQAILAGVGVLILVVILWTPYSYYSASQDNMAEFETNRQLIQGLLKAARIAKEPSPLPPAMPEAVMRSRIEGVFRNSQIPMGQVGEMASITDAKPYKGQVPNVVNQKGLMVPLKSLNLNQIITVGHGLQAITAGVKLIGMEITPSAGQTHYYDVVYRLVQFSVEGAGSSDGEMPSLEKRRGNGGTGRRFIPPPPPTSGDDGEGE